MKNKRVQLAAIIVMTLVVMLAVASGKTNSYRAQLTGSYYSDSEYPLLGPCSGKEETDLYELLPEDLEPGAEGFKDTVDVWSECYHDITGMIIKEIMSPDLTDQDLQSEAEQILARCLRTSDSSARCDIDKDALQSGGGIDCLSDSVEGMLKPSLTTMRLACRLPPWEDKEDLDMLSKSDTSTVLLEFLRTYECALLERRQFLVTGVREDLRVFGSIKNNVLDLISFISGADTAFDKEYEDQWGKINKELDIARPTLNRAIKIASGKGKLDALDGEIECLQRLSLDLRNAFALGAESASCMPRVWDAKDSLRDFEKQ